MIQSTKRLTSYGHQRTPLPAEHAEMMAAAQVGVDAIKNFNGYYYII